VARTAVLGRLIWQPGSVTTLHDETPTARTIVLEVAGCPGHLAGQHVDVRLTADDGYSAVRSYSLANAPDGSRVELSVAHVPDGEVSPYLIHDLAVGDRLEVRGPIGGWFVWRPAQTEPVQPVALWFGIRNRRSMLASCESATWQPSQAPTSYICGPTAFVELAADLLRNTGHDPARIKIERFGPSGGS
jgi:ferredoxin-NADP reductase